MVYCGKLSTACEPCRKRRIKCDEGRPRCSQCLRAQQPCSGYRDVRLLSFRDQNEEVIHKVHKRSATTAKSKKGRSHRQNRLLCALVTSSSTASGDKDDDVESVVTPLNAPLIPKTNSSRSQRFGNASSFGKQPSFPINAVARCFFWNNYVLDDMRSAQGWLGCLSAAGIADGDPGVILAIEAIGLASIANIQRAPSLMVLARKEYTKAVSLTNTILGNPKRRVDDSTLAAVILLGMFEVITSNGTDSIHSWRNHINGATKLIELRGIHQLHSPQGLQMFTQLRTQIIINNIYGGTNTSPLIAKLTVSAESLRCSAETFVDRLANIIIRLNNFYATVKAGNLSDPMAIVSQAGELDTTLVSWANSLPDCLVYSTLKARETSIYSHPETLLRGEYHIYPAMWVAAAWNNYRSVRIILHELILDVLLNLEHCSLGETKKNELLEAQSRNIIVQMVEDICAGALYHIGPYLLDDLSTASSSLPYGFSSSTQNIPESDISKLHDTTQSIFMDRISNHSGQGYVAAGGYLLIWPAFLAAACRYTHGEAYNWLSQCLSKIGYRMGINQALVMVDLLQQDLNSCLY